MIVLRYRSATIIEHSMCAVCDDDRVSNGATDADTDGEGLKQLVLVVVLITLGIPSVAWAQYLREQDAVACFKDQDHVSCPTRQPVCERLLVALEAARLMPRLTRLSFIVLNISSVCAHELGQPSIAESRARTSLELAIRIHGPEHPDVANSLNDLAFMLHSQGKV